MRAQQYTALIEQQCRAPIELSRMHATALNADPFIHVMYEWRRYISRINKGSSTTIGRVYSVHPSQGNIRFRFTLRVILQLI